MSMLSNSKVMLGAALAFLILSAPLSVLSTGAVEDAVDENFATFPTDTACANDDCTEAEEDWATSTGERSYYAWNLTNPGAAEPVYEQVGPFDYDITYTREIIDFNKSAGTLTYSESKVYTCAEDTATPCDSEVTTTNIPFQPQVVGATGLAIDGIMSLTKAGFAAGAINNEMTSFSAGKATADGLAATYGAIQSQGADAGTASTMIGVGYYDAFDAFFAASNMSGMNNMQGMGETITYTQAIQGQQQAAGETDLSQMFAGNATITNMSYAFDSAMMPTGEDVSLTGMVGVMVLAGHCNAFPTATYDEVMADAANGFANVGTMQRASIWGFTVMASESMPDVNATIANDWALCFGVGGTFANTHGGGDDGWFTDQTGTAVNASTRMMNYLGVDIDNAVAMNLLFGGQGEAVPTGLLATNAVGDESATAFGVATFIGMDAATAMSTYGLDMAQYGAIATWVGGWLTSQSALPMVLLGGSGTITAEEFVNVTLGGEDPINGGYLTYSLNLGGAWGTALMPTSPQGTPVSVDAATAGNLLYGPLGITTSTGAGLFLYGELFGQTPPVDLQTMSPGAPMTWNETTVSAIYGIDANAAAALRIMLRDVVYDDFVPGFLVGLGSDGPYKTQTVNEWLFGWRDPVSAFVGGDITNMSLGWTKLETNQTYYGSGGVSTGPATTYTICTGHNSDCDKGETLLEDGSNELSWHSTQMMMATFGLVGVETLNETTGGFLTGDGDKVDAGGYAITAVTCSGTSEVKNIPVDDCTASVDPTTRPITAKLIKSFTLVDAMVPALPVYFGTEINMQAEQLSGLIIAGDSTSTFYLDMREPYDRATVPQMSDLQPVFQIVQSSEIADDDAEDMESSIVTNQNGLSYWTNFDVPTDYIALLLYLGAVVCLVLAVMAMNKEEE
ncbi:MAG TPA: CD36 family protein [Candidatus Poseidoniaceae archaeon]|nr:CD36 family protein [Candidatus Poseidoniaceae archaeon]